MVGLVLGLLLALPSLAQEAGVFNNACFRGLDDASAAATLNPCHAQDTLNVESNLSGTSAIKRKGFDKTADLTYSTSPVNGSHTYIDSSGNKLDIVCHDRICAKSTNGNAFSNFLTTAAAVGALPRRWSFVDSGGNLYGGNDRYDKIMKYDGTTRTSPVGMPQGSILELAGARLAIGDITGAPNRVYYSSAGAVEQFTLGINPEDAYFDDIGAPGDKIRGLKFLNGVLYIFKTTSLTACELGNQYTTECSVVSSTLGTTDPASITTAGSCLYFRAQDKSYWEICRDGLRPISLRIPNLVKSQSGGLGGGEVSNTQTTRADWQAGTQSPSGSWNTATTPGSIFPSSFTYVDTSTDDFAGGTLTSISTNVAGEISLVQTGTATFRNAGAEAGDSTNIPTLTQWQNAAIGGSFTGFGSRWWDYASSESCDEANKKIRFSILNAAGSALTTVEKSITNSSPFADQTFTIDTSTLTANMVKLQVAWLNSSASNAFISKAFVRSAGIAVRLVNLSASVCAPAFDIDEGTYTLTGNIVSREFDTGLSTPTWGPYGVDMTSTTEGAVTFQTQVAASAGGAYDSLVSVTPGNRVTSAQKRYIKYKASFSVTASTDTAAVIRTSSLTAVTTGQFTTQCIQPNTSITAWGSLSCAETKSGQGSIVYYATSAASCALLPSTPPNTWQTSVTNGNTLSVAVGSAVYVGWRSLLGSTTDQAQVDACTLAWTEGTPAQPSWAVYDSIKNAIYWTTTINNAASSNRLLKYDLNLGEWYPFDIPAQAPRMINNVLHFGGASSGTWNRYGLVDADLGNPINAYWRSKAIGSEYPFQEKAWGRINVLARNAGTGSLTITSTYSNAQATNYTMSLSTGTGIQYARFTDNLPAVQGHTFTDVKFGNNSAVPFEVLGIGVRWTNKPERVVNP